MVFGSCVICFLFFVFVVVVFALFVFSSLQRGGLRFFVMPPFRKNTKGIFDMAAITLPLCIFPRSFYEEDEIV